ncbi:MAG: hypothetical protein LBM77_03965 [Spirochaetaceae bacterium]|jgi:antitoxin component YwqK of YwqJK toxin-antitoxin module|nr:hypothetical protein [Spirochaetaceae bacterium]
MKRKIILTTITSYFLLATYYLFAADWYVSNAGGMAMEATERLVALRSQYALSVETVPYSTLPESLHTYYKNTNTIQLRSLYKDGEQTKTQWRLLDAQGKTLVAAILNEDLSIYNVEMYNSAGRLLEEHNFDTNAVDYAIKYHYKNDTLISADHLIDGVLNSSDIYRYNRSKALRSVERKFVMAEDAEKDAFPFSKSNFPILKPHPDFDESFVTTTTPVHSSFLDAANAFDISGHSIEYKRDSRGRILSETRKDKDGNITGTMTNVWEGDRISSITWLIPETEESAQDERISEYQYDSDGDRINLKEYHNGELEREVNKEGEQEIETLYIKGKPALKAVWEGGRKISEEQIK